MDDEPLGPVLSIHGMQIRSTATPNRKAWTFHTSDGPISFHADREQLEQIGNFLIDAAKSLPSKIGIVGRYDW
jgi:hypothetical protein